MFHKHIYKVTAKDMIRTYTRDYTTDEFMLAATKGVIPNRTVKENYTDVLKQCSCGKIKQQTLQGHHAKEINDELSKKRPSTSNSGI